MPRPKRRPIRESRPVPAPLTARKEAARRRRRAIAVPRQRASATISAASDSAQQGFAGRHAQKSLGKLGTGHGRSEDSRVTTVALRARHRIARGNGRDPVRPPREPGRDGRAARRPYYARRSQPDPFPGRLRFAPDPR